MDLGLADRVYLVTGAARGLGRATAEVLVAEGARVVLSGRSQESVDAAVAALGDQAVGVAADNADPATPERLVAAAREQWARLDGALGERRWSAVGWGQGDHGRAVAPRRSTRCSWAPCGWAASARRSSSARAARSRSCSRRACAHRCRTWRSPTGCDPGWRWSPRRLADELAPRGVRVNGLLPGAIRTERLAELGSPPPEPVGRYGEPEEFGRVAAFLLSPAASYVSGAMVPVDGGALRAL